MWQSESYTQPCMELVNKLLLILISFVVVFITKSFSQVTLYFVSTGKEKLAEILSTSIYEAEKNMEQFNAKIPSLKQYSRKCVTQVRNTGRIQTLMGRWRKFPMLDHASAAVRFRTERQIVNFTVQGTKAHWQVITLTFLISNISFSYFFASFFLKILMKFRGSRDRMS